MSLGPLSNFLNRLSVSNFSLSPGSPLPVPSPSHSQSWDANEYVPPLLQALHPLARVSHLLTCSSYTGWQSLCTTCSSTPPSSHFLSLLPWKLLFCVRPHDYFKKAPFDTSLTSQQCSGLRFSVSLAVLKSLLTFEWKSHIFIFYRAVIYVASPASHPGKFLLCQWVNRSPCKSFFRNLHPGRLTRRNWFSLGFYNTIVPVKGAVLLQCESMIREHPHGWSVTENTGT